MKRLPWTYWLIVAVMIGSGCILGGVMGDAFGLNPYLTATLGGGLVVLYEVYSLKSAGASGSERREFPNYNPDCSHDWEFYEPDPRTPGDYTGYLERCRRCTSVRQIPQ